MGTGNSTIWHGNLFGHVMQQRHSLRVDSTDPRQRVSKFQSLECVGSLQLSGILRDADT